MDTLEKLQTRLTDLVSRYEKAQHESRDFASKVAQQQSRLVEAEKKIEALRRENEDLRVVVSSGDTLIKKCEALEVEKVELELQQQRLEAQVKALEQQVKELTQSAFATERSFRASNEALLKRIARLVDKIDQYQAETKIP